MSARLALAAGLACCALAAAAPGTAAQKGWMAGTEFDLVPYLSDGYYLSAIAGVDRYRLRYVRTELTVPGFITDDAFTGDERTIDAVIVDIYFQRDFVGWWLGPGLERWEGDVTEEASGVRGGYRSYILTIGGGYTWRFAKHFYLNPWAAVHVPVAGDREVAFPDHTFEIRATPEASVKLGIRF